MKLDTSNIPTQAEWEAYQRAERENEAEGVVVLIDEGADISAADLTTLKQHIVSS